MSNIYRIILATFCAANLNLSACQADDWPQWMGPRRDGTWTETNILQKFPSGGPKVLWRQPVGLGYSGPAVVNKRVLVPDYQRQQGDVKNNPGSRASLQGMERLLCLDAESGNQIWKYEYDAPYSISYPSGPRCTPTVDGDLVYFLGAEGRLNCLRLADGSLVWDRQLKKDYRCESPIWGFCAHPLVDGDTLYCVVGGEGSVVVAFDKLTGKEKWKGLTASHPGYCPPSIITAGGTRQLLIWDADKLNSLNPATGSVFWSEKLKPSYDMSIAMPRQAGDLLFASGIGRVGAAFKLDKNKPAAEFVWAGTPKSALYSANTTPILGTDGIFYGCDCESGELMAIDPKDGNRLWTTAAPTTGNRRGNHGTAFMVRNGDVWYLMSETGDLVLAKLSAQKYEELDRAHLLEPTGESFGRAVVWSHPAFANRCMFARNDREIICVGLSQ